MLLLIRRVRIRIFLIIKNSRIIRVKKKCFCLFKKRVKQAKNTKKNKKDQLGPKEDRERRRIKAIKKKEGGVVLNSRILKEETFHQ
jgi:hypothetical protein